MLDRKKRKEKGAGRAERSCTSVWWLLLLLAGEVVGWLVCPLRLVMAWSAVEGGRTQAQPKAEIKTVRVGAGDWGAGAL